MIKLLRTLKTSKSGASAAEYALILAVMGGFVVAGTVLFGQSLTNNLKASGDQMTTNQTTTRAATN